MKHLKAKYKLLLSYLKKDWNFEDYPLETWVNTNAQQEDIKFGAKFTNWSTLIAHGATQEDAIRNLKQSFRDYKENNDTIPRPGSFVPIEFAETGEVEKYESIAVDFFDKIIGINYYECFISDYSSLYDFNLDNPEILEKIKQEYNVEPEEDLILVDIFKQIQQKARA